jgi:hypothetical protein
MRTGKSYYADDPEQSRLCRGATSSMNHIWWKRSCFSKLGTHTINNEIPVRNDRRATLTMYSGHPMGLFPSQRSTKGSCYKRNGNP